jgi:hypothetical protein
MWLNDPWGGAWGHTFAGSWGLTYEAAQEEEEQKYGGWFPPEKKPLPEFHPWIHKLKFAEPELDLEEIPEPVVKIVTKIARKAIQNAAGRTESDVLEWITQQEQQALYERQLRMELSREKQRWEEAYAKIFAIAVQEALLAEEELVLLLLLEL